MMLSSWRLLMLLWCLLLIAQLSYADASRNNYDNDDDDVQSSDDVADHDDFYDDDTAWLPTRRVRRDLQRRMLAVDDVPARGAVDRATSTTRRDRAQSRRRKKLENVSRRGRGGGGRGWRRRGGGSFSETSAPISMTTISTTTDQRTSTPARPVVSHAVDLVARNSEVSGHTEVTEERISGRGVVLETISENGDDMMILLSSNGTTLKFGDISQRGVTTYSFLANVNSSSCSLYVIGRPSVCLSCALLRRLKFSAIFLRHLVQWPSMTFV